MSEAASSQMTHEVNDLQEEIAFQRVLLSSIDHNVKDREAAEQDVRNEIHSLESKLNRLKRAAKASTSKSSSQTLQPSPKQSRSSSRQRTATDDFTMNQDQGLSNWQAPQQMASTPSMANPFADTMDSPQLDLPSRKRSHSTQLDGHLAPIDNKSRRTTPSPFGTGPPTPSTSSSGYAYPLAGDGYFDLTFDDEFDAFDKTFFRLQQDEVARLEQERLDAEYARSIQDPVSFPQSDGPSSSMQPPARNAFHRLHGVQQQPSSSASPYASISTSQTQNQTKPGRKLPWQHSSNHGKSTVKAEPESMASSFKQETHGFAKYTNDPSLSYSSFKEEQKSRPMPGGFKDDSSTASDSDIEVIPASAFHDNGRHVQTKVERNPYAPESSRSSVANDALQHALYGSQVKHEWMNGAQPSMNGGFPQGQQQIDLTDYDWMNGDPSGWNGGIQQGQQKIDLTDDPDPPPFSEFFASQMRDVNPLAHLIARANNGNNYDELSRYLNLGEDRMDQLSNVLNDPRKNAEEIQALLENIQPDVDIAPENREGTPAALVYPLYEHQKLALTWMKAMETGTNKGGILADDMGLGKTISALALIHSRQSQDPARKTTLIVGPVALVRQWDRELRTKTLPQYRLSAHMVHGSGRKLPWDELRTYDVVFTTYGTLGAEYKRLQKVYDKMRIDGVAHLDQNEMKKTFPLLGPKSTWYRVLLDEAQCIKNKNTGAAKACCTLSAVYRFCLTGTPMMNNVGELYSLIHFLRIRPYNEWTRFQETFGLLTKPDPSKSRRSDAENAMRKLQALLKAILMRRTKKSLIDGKPIITLPPKTEEIQHVVFDDDERAFYSALESKTQMQFNKYMRAGTVGKNYTNVLVLLLRLRQACCHPHLIHDYEEAPANPEDANAMMELAKTLAPDVVNRILGADGAFECPVCYDVVINPKIITPCGHDTCANCMTRISDQADQQNLANGQDGAVPLRCPTCRGALALNKVIDHSAFKMAHNPEPVADEMDSDTESDSDDGSETESEEDSEDSDGYLKGFVVPDDVEDTDEEDDEAEDAEEAEEAEEADEEEVAPKKSKFNFKGKEKAKEKRRKSKGKGKTSVKTHMSIAMLKKEATKTANGRRKYMKYLRKNWQPSAKVTKTVDLLGEFMAAGQKTIIFSQFVSLLDLLQVPIDEKKWKCLRYDGSMSADARNDAILRFSESDDHNVMLISLKAGNAGLNLVAASKVIILDPFWNPYIEMQAVDRAYRIGQQNPVEVHRILIEGTVEDRIIELQEQKRKLVESALDENAAKSLGRLGIAQLAFLFNGNANPNANAN
ncbi:related to DNA repair protein RAD16 [Rhynchosporium graminicola]|uniref:Related to DNA repair protein RAD16 n=1 Tax=Rhynchosporium graminicola TaxID=2792576 RepID=A0A1E1K0C4_9HELO|nr:related to DNA repair protein RAD16 [Rhynchosporium commune]